MRFKNHGVAPKSAADFAFLLHGLHYLKDDGVMAIILPHGVLFRGGKEADIRRKLLEDGHMGLSEFLCVRRFWNVSRTAQRGARVKRSPYSIANWFMADFHVGLARFQSAVMLRNASQISLVAAASLGKCPRVLMILRKRECTLSMALVV